MTSRNFTSKLFALMSTIYLTSLWAVSVPCPIPASQIKAEWFQISNNKKEAHAQVRDNHFKIWTMNILSNTYLLDQHIIKRTLEANYSEQTAYQTLGCLKCAYHSNGQYPVDFWACGRDN